ncbi:MAG: hypothetical protein EU536_04000 [Promethearchaeota archaeon]|nr:MAG: hypothetical protein EU536_04000 [Candidatus Lokiarchaeota archaeon]
MVLDYILNHKTCKIIRCLIANKELSAYKISKTTNISYERTRFWIDKLKNAQIITENRNADNTKSYRLNEGSSLTQNLILTLQLDRIQFTNDFIFAINELKAAAVKSKFDFLIGEPIDINHTFHKA